MCKNNGFIVKMKLVQSGRSNESGQWPVKIVIGKVVDQKEDFAEVTSVKPSASTPEIVRFMPEKLPFG